jgi:hypothetical protein
MTTSLALALPRDGAPSIDIGLGVPAEGVAVLANVQLQAVASTPRSNVFTALEHFIS